MQGEFILNSYKKFSNNLIIFAYNFEIFFLRLLNLFTCKLNSLYLSFLIFSTVILNIILTIKSHDQQSSWS